MSTQNIIQNAREIDAMMQKIMQINFKEYPEIETAKQVASENPFYIQEPYKRQISEYTEIIYGEMLNIFRQIGDITFDFPDLRGEIEDSTGQLINEVKMTINNFTPSDQDKIILSTPIGTLTALVKQLTKLSNEYYLNKSALEGILYKRTFGFREQEDRYQQFKEKTYTLIGIAT